MNPKSLLCYCLYCPGMQVFGLYVINNGIIINRHHHRGCDWCDKWKSWRSRSQPKDLPESEIKDKLCISHAHMGRTVLTCWWTTSICIWLANESERHHRISFGMDDELARWFADGEKRPGSFALMATWARWSPQISDVRQQHLRLCLATLRRPPINMCGDTLLRSACRMEDRQTCGKKSTPRREAVDV